MVPNIANPNERRSFNRSEVLTVLPTNLGKNKEDPVKPIKHKTLYTVIDDKVYDITDFIHEHPGGRVIFTHIGKDATDVFACMHPPSAYETLANYYVGDINPSESESTLNPGFAQEIRKLRDNFRSLGYYDSSKVFYAYKILSNAILWVISVSILLLYPSSVIGVSVSGALMGLFFQQCGWLSHDFMHHQVFTDRRWNYLVAYLIGGVAQGFSASWWKNKHNTHHALPNVHEEDPDIDTAPILLWSDHALEFFSDLPDDQLTRLFARYVVTRQAFLFFPILSFARLSWARQSLLYVLPNSKLNHGPPCTIWEQLTLYAHWVWYIFLLASCKNTMMAILFIVTSQASCGFFLATVFALNHNGMPIYTKDEASEIDFYSLQIMTGRNVTGGFLTNWFCGGLNYQIEHHLFPNMPRHSFPKIQPVIEALCKERGIPYHQTSFFNGTLEYLGRLESVSKNARKLSKQL